jgi:hypothetical protein
LPLKLSAAWLQLRHRYILFRLKSREVSMSSKSAYGALKSTWELINLIHTFLLP